MRPKFKKIISLILLMVFLLPTIIKAEHHHTYNIIHKKDEKQGPVFKENCAICNFALPAFIPDKENIDLLIEDLLIGYINNYQSPSLFNHTQITFSLRGPPEG